MIITGNDLDEIPRLQRKLAIEFGKKSLGGLKYFLGIEGARSNHGIFIFNKNMFLIYYPMWDF